jgi:hypothetical protein
MEGDERMHAPGALSRHGAPDFLFNRVIAVEQPDVEGRDGNTVEWKSEGTVMSTAVLVQYRRMNVGSVYEEVGRRSFGSTQVVGWSVGQWPFVSGRFASGSVVGGQ